LNFIFIQRYGIHPTAVNTKGVNDRAKERRDKQGVDITPTASGKPVASASVSKELPEDNPGRKLLMKMGWKEGKGLGKKEDGIVEPV
jgi:hypothetical protein